MKKYMLIAMIVMLAAIAALFSFNQNLRKENQRLENNQEALLTQAEIYQTEQGHYAATVMSLELEKADLEQRFQTVSDMAKELNVKLSRVKAASSTGTRTEIQIRTEVKDSIIYRDGVIDSLRIIDWWDPWIDVKGELLGDSLALRVQSVDTLVQIVHRVPKKFLFFRFGTKAIRQEIVSKNPHTQIHYTEYIEMKK